MGPAAGGSGRRNFCHAIQTVLRLGMSRIAARAMPKRARFVARQPSARAMSRLIEVSSTEVDAVGEEGDGANGQRDAEFDSEVAEVEQGNQDDSAAQIPIHRYDRIVVNTAVPDPPDGRTDTWRRAPVGVWSE